MKTVEQGRDAYKKLASLGLRVPADSSHLSTCVKCSHQHQHKPKEYDWCPRCREMTDHIMQPAKQVWKFIGRDDHGWLRFRCIQGPGSIFTEDWVGDLGIEPDHFWKEHFNE